MILDGLEYYPLDLRQTFGDRLLEGEELARHTSCRIGGPADLFVIVSSEEELAQATHIGWNMGLDVLVLGSGSNVLVSDQGVRGLVILNHARSVDFNDQSELITVRSSSGTSLAALARMCAGRGASGLEWAVSVPGRVGGALVGNAGAHGGDIAGCLLMADILQRDQSTSSWDARQLELEYRGSRLKQSPCDYVVLGAEFQLAREQITVIGDRVESYLAQRRNTQPAGASIGSMFKNPSGDYAGRLIESVGLKGRQIGSARISHKHANFFVNLGGARAAEVRELIDLARKAVRDHSGVELELEIQMIGIWDDLGRLGTDN